MNAKYYVYFELNGITYRTDGSKVEGLDGSTWNATSCLNVILAARNAFKAATETGWHQPSLMR